MGLDNAYQKGLEKLKKYGLKDEHLRKGVLKTGDKPGHMILSTNPRESHVQPFFITVNSVDELKELGGVPNAIYEKNRKLEKLHSIPPAYPAGENDGKDPFHPNFCKAFRAYIYGNSNLVKSYKDVIDQTRFPLKVAVFAGEDIIVDPAHPLYIKSLDGKPVSLVYNSITVEPGGQIIWENTSGTLTADTMLIKSGDNLNDTPNPNIIIQGANGSNGVNGTSGADGSDGNDGSPGKDGKKCGAPYCAIKAGDGTAGSDGTDGEAGSDGGPGQDAGDITFTLTNFSGLVVLKTLGGNGGHGGDGGSGGSGGNGGYGGAASGQCAPGKGANGGNGGKGSNGGNGGNGGNSGNVYFTYKSGSPQFTVQSLAGNGGDGGIAGAGGFSGNAGNPGGNPGVPGASGYTGAGGGAGGTGKVIVNGQPI